MDCILEVHSIVVKWLNLMGIEQVSWIFTDAKH